MGLTEDLVNWTNEQKCLKAVESLGKHDFTAVYCPTATEAFDYIVSEAAGAETIGFGGSMTVADLRVEERLKELGKQVLNHSNHDLSKDERLGIMRRQLTCDLFLSGSNAVTLS